MPQGEDLRGEIALLRSDHRLLVQRVEGVAEEIVDLRGDLNSKHKENRASIHKLRDDQQTIANEVHLLQAAFDEDGAITYMKKSIEKMETRGWWIVALLISTLVGVIMNLAKH